MIFEYERLISHSFFMRLFFCVIQVPVTRYHFLIVSIRATQLTNIERFVFRNCIVEF
jgi:hypothetical protein